MSTPKIFMQLENRIFYIVQFYEMAFGEKKIELLLDYLQHIISQSRI